MADVVIGKIPKMQTFAVATMDPKHFTFIGSSMEMILSRLPLENVIIQKYKNIHISGERPIPDNFKACLDAGDISKRTGVKRKGKAIVNAVPKKAKSQTKLKSKKLKPAVVGENLDEWNFSVV